jgi:hypothetical protein
MMHDLRAAKILSYRRNIHRYSQLLAMELTELEREYLQKRIADEQAELKHWTLHPVQDPSEDASNVIAAQAVSNNQDGQSQYRDGTHVVEFRAVER